MAAEHASLTRVALLEPGAWVELLHASYVTHRFPAHTHEEVAIGVIEAGAVRTRLGNRTVVIPAGRIVALNPGTVHTGEAVTGAGYRYRMLYVDAELLRRATGARDVEFPRAVLEDPVLARRLARALALVRTDAGGPAARDALVETLGALRARHARHGGERPGPASRHAGAVRLMREYLEEEHARVVTLAELSGLTGLSPFQLCRVFRAAVGVPPYAYLALVRVRRARALIARGHPLSSVTYVTGFSDQSHLTRQFKRVVGVPPGRYARAASRA